MSNLREYITPNKRQKELTYKKLSLSQNKLANMSPSHQLMSNTNTLHAPVSALHRVSSTSSTTLQKSRDKNLLNSKQKCIMKASDFKQEKDIFKLDREKGSEHNLSEKVQNTNSKFWKEADSVILHLSSDSSENNIDVQSNISTVKRRRVLKSNKISSVPTNGKYRTNRGDSHENCSGNQHSNHLQLKKKSSKCPLQKNRVINTIMKEKITIKRSLTKSTNLKTFPVKFLPKNQSKIDNFFEVVTDPSKVKYFQTFSHSKSCNAMKDYVADYSEVVLDTLEQMKATDKIETTCDTIVLVDTDEDELDNVGDSNKKNPKVQSQIPSGLQQSVEMKTINGPSIFQYFSLRKTALKDSNSTTKSDYAEKSTSRTIKKCNEEPKTFEMKNKCLTEVDSESDSSIIFVYDNVPFERAGSVDYTPNNVQKKIEDYRISSCINASDDILSKTGGDRKNNTCKVQQTVAGKTGLQGKKKIRRSKLVECPNYKIIEGTSFAVDAFRFGYIEGITDYFLTHFHADHYIGLKKSFSKPIYLSEKTARLVRAFIRIRPEYLNIMEINQPIFIKDIEVTALEANHCPGAVMFLFKFPNGMCTLHTGDFRASPDMEMEPAFWNNMIYTIYLDTTYLSNKYNFKSQLESIADVLQCVEKFRSEHIGSKILFICGSYIIGKEKVWQTLAGTYNFKVWTDGNRRKALEAIGDESLLKFLTDDPTSAEIHILTMNQLSYDYLVQYLGKFSDYFDTIFAIRPSGWEKNSKPQRRGPINIIGIEYSEHSSYDELRRFVRYLQPKNIISTVPRNNDVSKTSKIPSNWFRNSVKPLTKAYQQSITNFVKLTDSSKKRNSLCYEDVISDLENGDADFLGGIREETNGKSEKDVVIEENNDSLQSDWMS